MSAAAQPPRSSPSGLAAVVGRLRSVDDATGYRYYSPAQLKPAELIATRGFDSNLAVIAAVLLVAGSALELLGGTVNWLQSTGDQFAEKSPGFLFNSLTGPLAIPGMVPVAYGVTTRL